MESEAAPAVSRSPAHGTPSPPPPRPPSSSSSLWGAGGNGVSPLLIRAPLSSPEKNVNKDYCTTKEVPHAASASAAAGSPSSSSEAAFLSGEDEPEFETASERPFVPEEEPDEEDEDLLLEFDPDSEVGGSSDDDDGLLLSPTRTKRPVAAMPKARVSWEDEDVPEEEDDDQVVDTDASPPLRVVRVPPSAYIVGVANSEPPLEVDDIDGEEEEKVEPVVPLPAESPGGGLVGNPIPEVINSGDGSGDKAAASVVEEGGGWSEEIEAPDEGGVPGEVSKSATTLPESPADGDQTPSKDDDVVLPQINPAAATELSAFVGPGDVAAAGEEDDGISDAGDENGVGLGGGAEEAIGHVTDLVGDMEPVGPQYDVRLVEGVEEEEEVSDGQVGKETALGGESEEATSPITEFPSETKPVEAESNAAADETGGLGGAISDDTLVSSTVPAVSLSEQAASPVTEVAPEAKTVEVQPATADEIGYVGSASPRDALESSTVPAVSLPEEAATPVTKAAAEAKPIEAESAAVADVTESVGSAGPDNAFESSTVPLVSLSEEATSPVIEVAKETKLAEAQSSAHADESGGVTAVGSDQIVEPTDEDEAPGSSEIKQMIGEVVEDRVLKKVVVPADSEEAEDSAHRLGGQNNCMATDESVSLKLRTKDWGDEEEEAAANFEAKSKVADPKLETDDGDMSLEEEEEEEYLAQTAKDYQNEEMDQEALEISCIADDVSVRAIYISHSELRNNADSSRSVNDAENMGLNEVEEEDDEEEGSISDIPAKVAVLASSETEKQLLRELEEGSSGTSSFFGSSQDYSHQIDDQIASDSDEEVETDEEGDGKELFDAAALAALLKEAAGASPDGSVTISGQDASSIFSVDRPAVLGSSVPSLKPAAPHPNRPSLFSPSQLAVMGEEENNMDEEQNKLQENVEQIRVKFLRLVHRLGQSPEDAVVAQVLYRLGLAEGIRCGRQIGWAYNLENAKKKALQLEEDEKAPLDLSCNILVLGKTGVGKSATINSIFGEQKVHTDAFLPATASVKEINGIINGVHIHVIDTPGLRSPVMDQAANRKILSSIKKYTKKCPPDIVLYVDRLDTQTRDFNDLPLLRSITGTLGPSIWFNAIVALTHAASSPPDGPTGSPLCYEVFIAQRSLVVQHSIRQTAGDMRLMNPVALVENHPSCRRNREGQRVLPNGLSWRPQMLLLCYSSKILSEANSILKLQDPSPGKLFGFRVRSPPLPFLLSSLLQSRAHPKLATDQVGENGDSDIDLADLSDSNQEEEEDEYDQLPPFKPLWKAQIAQLTKGQRKAYFDEYDYRVKLLQKRQWKEELRRLKEMKKGGKGGQDESVYGDMAEDYDQHGAPSAVPVPLPDMVLPPSFDCDSPAYRYRFLEPTSQLLARPVLDTHGWDHDCGYDGVSLEENLAIAGQFPAGIAVQITKDKKEFNIHLDSSVSAKHGENGSTLVGFDIQSVGKQFAYVLHSETKVKNLKRNITAAGISVTFLGENIATGLKVEDQLFIGKRVSLVASTGAVRAQGDVAYGANLEARLREDFPVGQDLSTLGLSLMSWHGDLALGANLQSQFSVGRNLKMDVRVGLNNKLSGQVTLRTSSSEQLQIALFGIIPIVVSMYRSIWPGESYVRH